MPESVHITIDKILPPVFQADKSCSSVIRPAGIRGSGLSIRPSWAFSAVFRTLPPLASVQTEPVRDPAAAMLAAVTAAGGCLEVPECGYSSRWVVPRPGGAALRFPSPVGHRLVSQGMICRHPSDVPGQERRFVRYIPREKMPRGFEFQTTNADAAHYRSNKINQITEEEYLAQQRASSVRRRARRRLLAAAEA